MPNPRVSVLVPCYNDGEWIDEAVQSVLDQTFRDFEIVIVDDGSTDLSTTTRLDALKRSGLRVVAQENMGLPAARNTAARHAAGEFFCALDADDRLAATWLEKAVNALDTTPSLAFVSHWLETFGDERWTWTPSRCDLPALLARNTVNGAALVRRSAFDAVGGYDERMRHGCEDWDFWLRLVERGFEGAIVPEILFYYRRRSSSMSRVMTATDTYRGPLEQLVERHEESYRRHLIDVLIAREAEKLSLRRQARELEAGRLAIVEPSMARALEELNATSNKVARARVEEDARRERERLSWEVAELRKEVAALRTSWSWRITLPLRWLYSWVRGWGG